MKNENNVFGKVTHDNLPQAVEHLIKMMEEQAQNSKNNMSVEDDEISIEEVSSLIKKKREHHLPVYLSKQYSPILSKVIHSISTGLRFFNG